MKSHRASPENWCCSTLSSGLKMRRLQSSSCSECQSICCKVMYFSKLFTYTSTSVQWSLIELPLVTNCQGSFFSRFGIPLLASRVTGKRQPLVRGRPGWLHCPSESRFEYLFDEYLPQKLLQFRCHGHVANFKSHC